MRIDAKGFDPHFFLTPEAQQWARRVFDADEELAHHERENLRIALWYPDLFEERPLEQTFYTVIHRSTDLKAQQYARELAERCSRFAELKVYLDEKIAHAARAREQRQRAAQVHTPAPSLGGLFGVPALQPAPVFAGAMRMHP